MKYTVITLFLFIMYSNCLFSQNGTIFKNDITRIEVSLRRNYKSIKLLQEGLLCENTLEINKGKYYPFSTLIPLHRIDTDKLNKLQWFIKNNSMFHQDSVIQDVQLTNSIDEHAWINILIIHPDYSSNYILWDTGESKDLVKCIELLNDLIPQNDRALFEIEPMLYIYSREKFEK